MLTYQLIPLSNPFQPLVLGTNVQKMSQSDLFWNAVRAGKTYWRGFHLYLTQSKSAYSFEEFPLPEA